MAECPARGCGQPGSVEWNGPPCLAHRLGSPFHSADGGEGVQPVLEGTTGVAEAGTGTGNCSTCSSSLKRVLAPPPQPALERTPPKRAMPLGEGEGEGEGEGDR